MSTLRTRCPDCGTALRRTAGDEPEVVVTWPKCGTEFTAAVEPAGPRRGAKPPGSAWLVVTVAAAATVLVGGVVVAVLVLGGSKDRE